MARRRKSATCAAASCGYWCWGPWPDSGYTTRCAWASLPLSANQFSAAVLMSLSPLMMSSGVRVAKSFWKPAGRIDVIFLCGREIRLDGLGRRWNLLVNACANANAIAGLSRLLTTELRARLKEQHDLIVQVIHGLEGAIDERLLNRDGTFSGRRGTHEYRVRDATRMVHHHGLRNRTSPGPAHENEFLELHRVGEGNHEVRGLADAGR